MTHEDLNTRKRVPISDVKPGMFVIGLDRSWLQTPFVFHRKLIKGQDDIALFERHGIREVIIDTARSVGLTDGGYDEDGEESAGVAKQTLAGAAGANGSAEGVARPKPADLVAADLVLQPLLKELPAAKQIHEEALEAAQSIFDGARGGWKVKSDAARKVVGDLVQSVTRSPEANMLLMQMRRFQRDLFTHSVNVCVLALVVAALDDFGVDLTDLGVGALLHDVGETRIPRNLLRKKDGLTDSERRLLEQHPRLGAMLLDQNCDLTPGARQIVAEHHERVDGSGFPSGLRGGAIALASQIVAITDTYDDMISGRNQPMLQPVEILRQLLMQSTAGTLDRVLVERVIHCLGIYPIGSLVELNTGERAIVIAANRSDSRRPTVRIVMSSNGLMHGSGPIVSLADSDGGALPRRIVGTLDSGKERIDPMVFLKLAPAAVG